MLSFLRSARISRAALAPGAAITPDSGDDAAHAEHDAFDLPGEASGAAAAERGAEPSFDEQQARHA